MEYCSPLWAAAPASHLSRLHAVETRAFRIIGISHDEAVFGFLTVSPQAGWCSFCLLPSHLQPHPPCFVCDLFRLYFRRVLKVRQQPLLVKLPKSRIAANLHSFIPLFSHLWNKLPHSLQSHSSLQVLKTAVHHHLLSSPIQKHDLLYPS